MHSTTPPSLRIERSGARRRPLISLTPLIDMVFILLVFFMLASSFLDWRSIELAAGEPGAAANGLRGALLLEIESDGLRLAGRAVDRTQAAAAVRRLSGADAELRVLVRPGPGVPLQRTIDLLDAVRAAGARNVFLVGAGAP